jgi:hypothetical protein
MFGYPPGFSAPVAQSETKRQDLARVEAIRQLFHVDNFNIAWVEMDVDNLGHAASYNMEHARDLMREILTEHQGEQAPFLTKEFLRNATLMLWNMTDGLLLEHFLGPKGKITSWDKFQTAWLNMREAYFHFVGGVFAAALDNFYFRICKVHREYGRISVSTLLHFAQQRFGLLKTMTSVRELPNVLDLTRDQLQDIISRDSHGTLGADSPLPSGGKRMLSSPEGDGPDKRKMKTSQRPVLHGMTPCWDWILQKEPCKGRAQCAHKSKKPGALPPPHSFAKVDKGATEKAYRAWLQRKCA